MTYRNARYGEGATPRLHCGQIRLNSVKEDGE